jgi:tetratricopeptide (TPR) repeat protein
MNKFKTGLLLFVSVFVSATLFAQSLEEGKKFMYYERYKSAKDVFQKLVDANANNTDAVYWLGQAMILSEENSDVAGAKALYQKTLMNNSNSALLLAGMGHIELLEGKQQDARNRFETAISISQGKNKDVLNAVGFANIQAEKGDANYAVEKLTQATALKKMTDPDVWANLGDAYRKLTQGGPAQNAYEKALEFNPNYARSSYRIGKIYVSQGPTQKDIYERYFNEAIAKDPAYAPVYRELYQIYYTTNVTKSAENLEKYLANSDTDPRKDCYYRASMKYAQGLFAEAVSVGNGCIASGGAEGPIPNVYGLIGYAYDKLGDSINAKASFEKYFEKQKPEKIGSGDYATYGEVLLKMGMDSLAGINIEKAVAMDTTEKGKVDALKVMAVKYEKAKRYKDAADWYSRVVRIKQNLTKTDIYNAAYNYYRVGEYTPAISFFNMYGQKFPEDPLGFYLCGKSNWAVDSTLELGSANTCFEKTIELAQKDSVKYKAQLVGSLKYFVVYSVYKRDKTAALAYADRILGIDPADAETIKNREIIPTINFGAPAAPRQQNSGGGNKAGAAAKPGGR